MSNLLRHVLTVFVSWLLGEDALLSEVRAHITEHENATRTQLGAAYQRLTQDISDVEGVLMGRLQQFQDDTLQRISEARIAQLHKLESDIKGVLVQAERDGQHHRDLQEIVALHFDRALQRPDERGMHARRLPPA